MVGNDAERLGRFLIRAVLLAGQFGNLRQNVGEGVRLVDGLFARQHTNRAFQTHASIDVLLLERNERTVLLLVVLHEHVVPDFQIRAAVAGRRAVRAAGLFGDDEHLGIRAARAGDARRAPPVVLLRQIEQVVILHAAAAP